MSAAPPAKKPRSDPGNRDEDEPYPPSCKLNLGGLSQDDPFGPFKDMFKKLAGRISFFEAHLTEDPGPYFGRVAGWADITFFNPEAAQKALDMIKGRISEDGTPFITALYDPQDIPTTKRVRERVDGEPTEDFDFVVYKQKVFLLHHETEYEEHRGDLKKGLAGGSDNEFYAGEFGPRLKECLAKIAWGSVIVLD